MKNYKIYDGFCFLNELELLELRLNTLNHIVDYFVIVESNVTHSGNNKPYYFEENKQKFSKFSDKIIHLKIIDTPDNFGKFKIFTPKNFDEDSIFDIHRFIESADNFNRFTQPHYGRDFYQKECVRRGLFNAKNNDIILSSDLDEIPNPEILERLDEFYDPNEFYTFNQTRYCYYLNLKCLSHIDNTNYNRIPTFNWKGTRMGSYNKIKKYSLNKLRQQDNIDIINGGWHFSYMGGKDRVKYKIESYSAIETNTATVMNNLEFNLENEKDLIYRGDKLIKVEIDESYPSYLLENLNNYKHFIK